MSSSSSSPPPTCEPSIFSTASSRRGSESSMTSPVPETLEEIDENDEKAKGILDQAKFIEEMEAKERLKRLTWVLERSSAYSKILSSQMDAVKAKSRVAQTEEIQPKKSRGRPPKRRKLESDDEVEPSTNSEGQKFQQPAEITGGTLKDYQLDGVAWMVSLYENGISGILADEMGLGKTLQTIAFCAYLRGKANSSILIVCPLSVLHNWVDEFTKFAPSIPVCMYHGTPQERSELRKTVMRKIDEDAEEDEQQQEEDEHIPKPGSRNVPSRRKLSQRKFAKATLSDSEDDEEYVDESAEDDTSDYDTRSPKKAEGKRLPPQTKKLPKQTSKSFPIVITTYEIIMKDRRFLASYEWGFIAVDEGHRLKNFNCKLVQEIKKYPSASRMILTGTPLHNNLGELWSLLNFILPDIFNDLDSFQAWFNVPSMRSSGLSDSHNAKLVMTLHEILKPFLLRRVKADVETNLPPKKEYILYAPLTEEQRRVYQVVLEGGIRRYLIEGARNPKEVEEEKKAKFEKESVENNKKMQMRQRGKKRPVYDVDDSDDEAYFKKLESGEFYEERRREEGERMTLLGEAYRRKKAATRVNNLRLLNIMMQLRKVCSHPFLFDWPIDPDTNSNVINDELVNASGKMLVLDKLLTELFRRGHKVLLFSQFTTMLDIVHDWAIEYKGWSICRIDGSTKPLDRREEMNRFQNGGDTPDAPHLFLLSTRAGGLGINLTAADTVIFYDQDWNPQMDIQAQDRAHRIGQRKPVLIFRLMSAHTIETQILKRATDKRKLETIVIAKDRFKAPATLKGADGGSETLADLAAALMKLEGEKINVVPNTEEGKTNVISDEVLDLLLDRSPEVFDGRGEGWAKGLGASSRPSAVAGGRAAKMRALAKAGANAGGATFEVYVPAVDVGNDALGRMLDTEEAPAV